MARNIFVNRGFVANQPQLAMDLPIGSQPIVPEQVQKQSSIPSGYKRNQAADQKSLAQSLMTAGSSTAPVQSGFEALARAIQGAAGGYMARKAGEAEKENASALAQALANRASSEDLANMGYTTEAMAQINAERENQDKLAFEKQKQKYKADAQVDKPFSVLGKLNADLKSGKITQEQHDREIADMYAAGSKRYSKGVNVSVGAPSINIPNPYQPLTKPTQNLVQKDLYGSDKSLNKLEDLKTLTQEPDIKEAFMLKNDLSAKVGSIAERLTGELPQFSKNAIQRREAIMPKVTGLFNAYRKDITGAAAAEAELKRLEESYLNKNLSYTEFLSRLDTITAMAKAEKAQQQDTLRNGLNVGLPDGQESEEAFLKRLGLQ